LPAHGQFFFGMLLIFEFFDFNLIFKQNLLLMQMFFDKSCSLVFEQRTILLLKNLKSLANFLEASLFFLLKKIDLSIKLNILELKVSSYSRSF
jgi:hypothetical protein